MTFVTREPTAMRTAVLQLRAKPLRWLVTGSGGFIGSHLLEALLRLGQDVVSVDNFETGHRDNLEEVRQAVGDEQWERHQFLEADIVDPDACRRACRAWASMCLIWPTAATLFRSMSRQFGDNITLRRNR